MHLDSTSPRGMLFGAIIGAILIFFTWTVSAIFIILFFGKPNGAGEFGDLFGAINALFSGLAFLGVIVAIILQRQELIEQRNEIRQARMAHEQSAAALQQSMEDAKLKTQLESLNLVIGSYRHVLEDNRITTTLLEKEQRDDVKRKLFNYENKLREIVDKIIT